MNPYQNYQRIGISTADPLRLVVMLYEGAIKNLNQAARLLNHDDAGASARINRALEIINYLRNALDHEQGGEIAFNLERLYAFMRDALCQANIQRDKAKIAEVIGLLQTLLDGWRGIASRQITAHDAAALPAAPPAEPVKLSLVG